MKIYIFTNHHGKDDVYSKIWKVSHIKQDVMDDFDRTVKDYMINRANCEIFRNADTATMKCNDNVIFSVQCWDI